MKYTELKSVAEDVCSAANDEFARQGKHTEQRWTICCNKKTLECVDLVDRAVSSTVYSIQSNASYIKFKEYIENLDNVRTVIPTAGYHTQPRQIIYNPTRINRKSKKTINYQSKSYIIAFFVK